MIWTAFTALTFFFITISAYDRISCNTLGNCCRKPGSRRTRPGRYGPTPADVTVSLTVFSPHPGFGWIGGGGLRASLLGHDAGALFSCWLLLDIWYSSSQDSLHAKYFGSPFAFGTAPNQQTNVGLLLRDQARLLGFTLLLLWNYIFHSLSRPTLSVFEAAAAERRISPEPASPILVCMCWTSVNNSAWNLISEHLYNVLGCCSPSHYCGLGWVLSHLHSWENA